jgi:hypothetical protein
VYLYGHQICPQYNDIKTPCKINNLENIASCLNYIDSVSTENSSDNNSDNYFKQIIHHLANFLDNLDCDNFGKRATLNLLSEQLNLLIKPKERYGYSTNSLTVSSIIHTISPHAYKYLWHYGSLILPRPSTIKTICNTFLTDPTDRQLFLVYSRNIFKLLDPEKNVMLLKDEIHIQPYMKFKGGNIIGSSFNNSSLATAAYTFIFSSITFNFEEVMHIFLTSTMKSDTLFDCIRTVITKLEDIGYRIFCVLSDNNAVNGKAMNNFSPKK